MKKIIFLFMLAITLFVIAGCNGSSGGGKTTGTYYEYEQGVKVPGSWVELKSKNKWIDDDGVNGRYEIVGNTIIFYSEIFGSEEEMFSGTIENGIITITIKPLGTKIYAKDNALPELNDLLDITSVKDITKEGDNLTITVDYQLQEFDLESKITISSGAVLKVYTDQAKKKLVEDIKKLQLGTYGSTFYIDIVDPNHNVSVKSYTLRINKNIPYTVTFANPDETIISTIEVIDKNTLESVPINEVDTPIGYEVIGWYYYTYDGWGSKIKNEVEDILNFPITRDYTFYPEFGKITYRIVLSDVEEVYEVKYNESFTLPQVYKSGYTFDGWRDQGGNRVTDRNGKSIGKYTYTYDSNFQAIWIPIDYDLYIETAVGGTTYPSGTVSVPFESFQTIRAIPSAGYEFDGWYINDVLISSEEVYNYTMTSSYVRIEPRFKIITFTITYHLNGGINSSLNNITTRNINTPNIYLNEPSKEYYTFDGWYTDEYYQERVSYIRQGYNGDINLYAKFIPTTYKITYNLNGGLNSSDNRTTYSIVDEFIIKDPSRAGYTFAGWYNDPGLTIEANTTIKKGSYGNFTIYAKWLMNTYNVIYHLNEGSNHKDNILTANPLTNFTLKNPTRVGYTFDGWFTQPDYKYAITTITNVTKDLNLYARWVPNRYDATLNLTEEGTLYRVRFHENGATNKINDIFVTNKTRLTLPSVPTKPGYLFAGWYTDYELTKPFVLSSNTVIKNDIELYAKWNQAPYGTQIIGGVNGWDGSTLYFYSLGKGKATLYASGYQTPSGYQARLTFGPTTIHSAASTLTIDVEPYQTYKISAYYWNSNSGHVITANNMSYSVSVSYDSNLGGYAGIDTVKLTYDQEYELPVPEMKYYRFDGWFTNPNGEGEQLTDSLGKSLKPWTITSNTKLYAKFTEINYQITYHLDSNTTNHKDNLSEYGKDTKGQILDPLKAHYTFDGWYLNSEFKGRKVESYDKLFGDVTLYPKFVPIQYSIVYNLNGGKSNSSLKTKYTVLDKFQLQDPTRVGYTFAGWYFDSLYTEYFDGNFDGNTNGNITIYAKWDAINYKIEYYLNGGKFDAETFKTYTIESNLDLVIPTRTGYTFMGWYIDPEFKEELERINPGTYGDYLLFAKWEITKYYINYVLYGGENHKDNPLFTTILSTSYNLYDPTLAGYVFEGWFTDEDFTNPITKIPAYTYEVLNIYARFTPLTYKLTFETNGGSIIEDMLLDTDQVIDFKITQKDNYSFAGWYLDKDLTIKNEHKVMPAYDLILYAKWIDYEVNINYNSSLNAVRAEGDILPSDFDAEAIDTDGDKYPIEVTIAFGAQEPTSRIVVRLKAIGKYGYQKTVTIENVIVYGTPSINYDKNITSIKETDEITLSLFKIEAKDTENNVIENTSIELVDGEIESGKTISVKILTVDIIGNQKELIIDNIKVYGTPTISAVDANLKSSKTNVIPSDFNAIAKDAFNKSINVTASAVKYSIKVDRKNNTSIQTITVNHNDYLQRPLNPTYYGYVFEGWYYMQGNLEKRFDFTKPIESDYEIYAKYISSSQTKPYIYYNTKFTYNVTTYGGNTSDKYKFYSEFSGTHKFNIENLSANSGVNGLIRIFKNGVQVTSVSIISYGINQSYNVTLEKNTLYEIEFYTYYNATVQRNVNLTITHDLSTLPVKGIPIKLYQLKAVDHLGNEVIEFRKVYFYSEPVINVSGRLDYIVGEEITLESLGVSAIDTFEEELGEESLSLNLIEGSLTAGSTVIYEIKATDKVGNISTKQISVKIYGKPTINYTPRAGIRVNEEINASMFSATAKDSHNKNLTVTATLQQGSIKVGGAYVNIILTATDHLNQTTEIIVEDIPVFDVNDIFYSIKIQNITEVSIYNNALEFQPTYTSTFGSDKVKVYIEHVSGLPLIHNTECDIVIVFEDFAGNKKYSEVIKNIKVFDHEVTFISLDKEYTYKISHNASLATIIPNVTKEFSYLDGWYTNEDFTGNKYTSLSKADFKEGYITLYANWIYRVEFVSSNTYRIEYNLNGGNINGNYGNYSQIATDIEQPIITTPTRYGYRFVGWYTSLSGGTLYTFSSPLTSNITLYARWESFSNSLIDYNRIVQNYSNGNMIYYFIPFKSGTYTITYKGLVTIYNYTTSTDIIPQTKVASNTTNSVYLYSGQIYRIYLSGYSEGIELVTASILITDNAVIRSSRTLHTTKVLEIDDVFSEVLESSYSDYQWYYDINLTKPTSDTFKVDKNVITFDSVRRFIIIYGKKN